VVLASGDQRRGAVAGVVAPVVFLGGLAVLDVLAGRVEVSDHELGPRSWLMHGVFLVTGLLVLAFAAALGRQIGGRRSGRVARFFVALFGLGAVLGTFTPDPDEPHTWHGLVHFAGFLLVTLALLPGMIAFAVAVRRDAPWRGFAWGSIAAAVLIAVVVFAPTTSSGNDYALWTGPASMLELVLLFAWIEVVALRLRGLSVADRVEQNGRPAATAATT
jgi:hypothetical membrane protein